MHSAVLLCYAGGMKDDRTGTIYMLTAPSGQHKSGKRKPGISRGKKRGCEGILERPSFTPKQMRRHAQGACAETPCSTKPNRHAFTGGIINRMNEV